MKRFASLISLTLCALMLFSCAVAEEAYVPGEVARQLISESFNAGRIITGDVKLRLDVDAAALGLDEEETAILETVLPLLDSVSVGLGAGKTENGIRIEADAWLNHAQGGEDVAVDIATNLDLYGISVESDLIPGERVTSKWETLLAMAGMNDSDISMLIMLRDMDWEAMLPQMIAMAESYVQMGLQYAQPYGEIALNWVASLPMTLEAGPAPEGCPEGASVSSVIVTEKDIMNLAAALAEYLKNDAVVSGLCNLLIQEFYTGTGAAPTTAQLCDQVIAEAAACTNTEDHLKLTWGIGADDTPVYGAAELVASEAGSAMLSLSGVPSAEGHVDYAFAFDIVNPDSTPLVSMSCAGKAGADLFTASAQIADEGTQIMGMEYSLSAAPLEDGSPGQKFEQKISMAVDDGTESVQMVGTGTASAALTIDGGEVLDETMVMDMYVDGVQVTTTALETLSVYPDTEGFVGTYSTLQNMPQMGVNAVGIDVYLGDHAYDPATTAALREIAFETSSKADIDKLVTTVMTNGQYKLLSAMQALPTEVLSLLIGME